jgi:hypothetical protein
MMIEQETLNRIQAGVGVQYEMDVVGSALRQDQDYMWSWFCTLVISFTDSGCDKKQAMMGAARFLQSLCQVDVTQMRQYQQDLAELG